MLLCKDFCAEIFGMKHRSQVVKKLAKKCEQYMDGRGCDDTPAELKVMLSYCAPISRDPEDVENAERLQRIDKKQAAGEILSLSDEEFLEDGGEVSGTGVKAEDQCDEATLQNDRALLIAASGALAQLTENEVIAKQVSLAKQFNYLLGLCVYEQATPDLEIRAVTALCNIIVSSEVLQQVKLLARGALEKRRELGWTHPSSSELYGELVEYIEKNAIM